MMLFMVIKDMVIPVNNLIICNLYKQAIFIKIHLNILGLPLSEQILPDYLRSFGYKNHILGKWHLGHFKQVYTPLFRGFDSHFGYWTCHQDYFDHTAVESVNYFLNYLIKKYYHYNIRLFHVVGFMGI